MKLSCNVTRDLLPLYHDGVCSEESRALVEAHLGECAECGAILKELQDEIEVPHETPDDQAVLKKLGRNVKRAWIKGAAGVLAAVLALAAGLFAWGYTDWAMKKAHYERFVEGKDDYRLVYRHTPSESLWDGRPEHHTWSGIGYRFSLHLYDPFRDGSEMVVMPLDNRALFEGGDSRYIYLALTVDRDGAVTYRINIEKPILLIDEEFEITWSLDFDTHLLNKVYLAEGTAEHSAMLQVYEDQILELVAVALEQWPFLSEAYVEANFDL